MFRAALTWIWGTRMNSSHSGLERPVESIRSRSHCPSHRCRISSDQSSLPVIAIEVLVLRSAPLAPLQIIWRNANRRYEGRHVLVRSCSSQHPAPSRFTLLPRLHQGASSFGMISVGCADCIRDARCAQRRCRCYALSPPAS
jgi:hypothetical protein